MDKGIRKPTATPDIGRISLGELIHQHVRVAIETAVYEELHGALGVRSYERHEARRGYRNGTKTRTLTGPSGPLALTVPRATLFGGHEWTSVVLPRYQRRLPEMNEAIAATYLAGGNGLWSRSRMGWRRGGHALWATSTRSISTWMGSPCPCAARARS
jgi:transposase-like protein